MALEATGETPAEPEVKRPAEIGAAAEDNCEREREREMSFLFLKYQICQIYTLCSGITVSVNENE